MFLRRSRPILSRFFSSISPATLPRKEILTPEILKEFVEKYTGRSAVCVSSHLIALPSCFFCGSQQGVYLNSKQPQGLAYSCNKCHHKDTWNNVKTRYAHYNETQTNVLNAQPDSAFELEPSLYNLSPFVPITHAQPFFDQDQVIRNKSLVDYRVTQKTNSQNEVVYEFLRTFDKTCDFRQESHELLYSVGSVVECNTKLDGEVVQDANRDPHCPISLFGWHMAKKKTTAILTDDCMDALTLHSTLAQNSKWDKTVILAADQQDLTKDNYSCLLPYLSEFEEVIVWTRERSCEGSVLLTGALNKAFNMTPLKHEDMAVFMNHGAYSIFRRCPQVEDRLALWEYMLDRKDGGRDLAYQIKREREAVSFMDLKYLLHYHTFEKGIGQWNRFDVLNEYLLGFRLGELTVMTGPTGSGKTTWLGEYFIDLIQSSQVRSMLYSFEMDAAKMYYKLCCQYARRPLREDERLARIIHAQFTDSRLMTCVGPQEIRKLRSIDIFEKRLLSDIRQKGIQHIVIDNLQYLAGHMPKEGGKTQLGLQEDLVCMLRDVVNSENVHITMVVHPRKTDHKLDMNAIYGGGRTTQEADNVFILHRDDDNNRTMELVKNRSGARCTTQNQPFHLLFDEGSFCHKMVLNDLRNEY